MLRSYYSSAADVTCRSKLDGTGVRLSAVRVIAVAFSTAVFLLEHDAGAVGPVQVEVGAKVAVGTSPGGDPINTLGFGLGARAGVSWNGLYGGASFVQYFGGHGTFLTCGRLETCGSPSVASVHEHSSLAGIEAGYGARVLKPLAVRLQVGLGSFTFVETGLGPDVVDTSLYVEPSVVAMVFLGRLFIAAGAGLLVLPSRPAGFGASASTDLAATAHGQIGVTF